RVASVACSRSSCAGTTSGFTGWCAPSCATSRMSRMSCSRRINAFVHLHQFERRSQFSTWLTRIALNEAFARRKKTQAADDNAIPDERSGELMNSIPSSLPDPERQAYAGELTRALEQAIDTLPETYRVVFMLRDVEGLSTLETAEGLGLGDEAVK